MNAHQPYILARTMKDAHAFARGPLGLPHGKYRVVTHASTIKSVRKANLFLVPGYEKRYDRFAINGALRWTRMNPIRYPEGMSVRDLEVAYRYNRLRTPQSPDFIVRAVSDDTEPPKSHTDLVARVKPDGLNPPGEQLALPSTEELQERVPGFDRNALLQEMSDELEDDEAEEPVVKRRRRRCNDCGTLHFKTDACPGDPFPVD